MSENKTKEIASEIPLSPRYHYDDGDCLGYPLLDRAMLIGLAQLGDEPAIPVIEY
jgi:hypothetical protein